MRYISYILHVCVKLLILPSFLSVFLFSLILSFLLSLCLPSPSYNMPHASCLLLIQLEEKRRRISGIGVGSLKFLNTYTTSSRHSKSPVMPPPIASTSLLSKCLIICKFEKSRWLSCYISLNVKIWGVLTVLRTECQTVPGLTFEWCKYDFSGWDPNSSCWKQLNSTDATLEFSTCFHHQVTLPIRKQVIENKTM